MGQVRLDVEKLGRMGFWTLPTDENRAIRKTTEEHHFNGGAIWAPSP